MGELSRRGVSAARAMLLTSAVGLLLFFVALTWLLVGVEDLPPPAGVFYGIGAAFGAAMLALSYWLLKLAGDPSVSRRGAELQAFGVKACPDSIVQLDEALRVVGLNPAAERRFRHTGPSASGMPLGFLLAGVAPGVQQEAVRDFALRAGVRLGALAQPLSGYTELALLNVPEGSAASRDIEEIGRSASRIALLGQTLELFGGSSRVECRPVDLHALLDEMATDFRLLLAPGTRLEREPPAGPLIVEADARLTRLAILLLVSNAEESIPPNSTIAINAAEGSLRIADRGAGLPDTVRAALFTPLTSTKDAERGLGLGLAAARAAMRLQRADLQVVRSSSLGTVVSLDFPQPAAADIRTEPADAVPASR